MILNPHIQLCLFHFLFSLNSHSTKMLCTICLSMAKVCNYQCRFFFLFHYYSIIFLFLFSFGYEWWTCVFGFSQEQREVMFTHAYTLKLFPKLISNVCLYYKVQCPKENLEKNKASENIVNVVYLECLIFGGNWFFNRLAWIWISVFQDAPIFYILFI